jgi:hypothetical protein
MDGEPVAATGTPPCRVQGLPATVIPMELVGIVRLVLVGRRHVDLLRCASALCRA